MKLRMLFCFLTLLVLASCAPARGDADKKLARACAAAVEVLAEPGTEIFIKDSFFNSSKASDGLDLRGVTIEARISVNKGAYRQKTYECAYEERFGPFNIGYSAKFHHMKMDGIEYGNIDGTISGDFNELMKITQATDDVLLK